MPDPNPMSPEEQFIEVAREYSDVRHQYEAAPSRLKGVLGIALKAATDQIHEVLADPEIVQNVEAQKEALAGDVALISGFIDKGMLTHEQAQEEMKAIVLHEDYRLMHLYDKLSEIIVGQTTEVVSGPAVSIRAEVKPVPTETAVSAPAHTEQKRTSEIEGKDGKYNFVVRSHELEINGEKYPDTIHGDTKARKIAVVQYAAGVEPGQLLVSDQIWEEIFHATPSVDKTVAGASLWARKSFISDTGVKVLEHNGKRGPNSSYIRRDVDIQIIDERQERTNTALEIELTSEKEKLPVRVTFQEKTVRLGKREGRDIPYTSRLQEGHRDYSELRKKALLYIAENKDLKLSCYDLWCTLEEGNTRDNYDKNTIGYVWGWLQKLTYRKKPLVAHHGAGSSSTYQFSPEFEPEIIRKDIGDNDGGTPVEPNPAPSPSLGPEAVNEPVGQEHDTQGGQRVAETSRSKEIEDLPDFRLALVASGLLSRFNFLLEANDFPVVTDDVIKPLRPYGKTSENAEEVLTKYVDAAQMLVELLDERNVSLLDDLAGLIATHDPRAPFADFLLTVVTEQGGKELLSSLVQARVLDEKGNKSFSQHLNANNCTVIDSKTGIQLWPQITVEENAELTGIKPLPVDLQVSIRNTAEVKVAPPQAKQELVSAEKPRDRRLDDFEAGVANELKVLEMHGITTPTIKRSGLRLRTGSSITGTNSARGRLLGAGLITREEHDAARLELRTVVLMRLFNRNRHLLGKGSRLQNHAVELVENLVEDFLSRQTA